MFQCFPLRYSYDVIAQAVPQIPLRYSHVSVQILPRWKSYCFIGSVFIGLDAWGRSQSVHDTWPVHFEKDQPRSILPLAHLESSLSRYHRRTPNISVVDVAMNYVFQDQLREMRYMQLKDRYDRNPRKVLCPLAQPPRRLPSPIPYTSSLHDRNGPSSCCLVLLLHFVWFHRMQHDFCDV